MKKYPFSLFYSTGNLLVNMPIAQRLTLGFLLSAVIAAMGAGIVGVQHIQSANKEASFYQTLLQTNTNLNIGASYLQLMNTKLQQTVDDATSPDASQETLVTDQNALHNLANRYGSLLSAYQQKDLLEQHSDQVALLAEGGHEAQVAQQKTQAGSALRTWQVYQTAQNQVIDDISSGDLLDAQNLERAQAEPTGSDALSALQTLIRFDSQLALSVSDAMTVETQNQITTTIIASAVACISIIIIGWAISITLIRRLHQLLQVIEQVQAGQLQHRVTVIGRDEIAEVSKAVNGMLDAIVGLLQETRGQRDALTNAARHLFSYIQVASAGELRVNTLGSDDPISLLADAFNFTIGRFRRFVHRTQAGVEQLEVVSRKEIERSEGFLQVLRPRTGGISLTSWSGYLSKDGILAGEGQFQELMGLSMGFARDVAATARRTGAITQEMRNNIMTFKGGTKEEMARLNAFNAPSGSLPLSGEVPKRFLPGT
jgi:methyl-accepting chemotaxis protein